MALIGFTKDEIKNLVSKAAPCIIIAGEKETGKSSIAGSLIKKASFLNAGSDRTVVMNYFNLELDNGDIIPLYDVGGHNIYHEVWNIFIRNEQNVMNLVTHSLESKEYLKSFQWIKDSIETAPLSQTILVPTKADKVIDPAERCKRIEQLIEEVCRWTDKQIRFTKRKIQKLQRKGKKNEHSETVLKKYIEFAMEVRKGVDGRMLFITTCKDFNTIEALLNRIIQNSLENKVKLTSTACSLYEQIGKIGLKKDILSSRLTQVSTIDKADEYDGKETSAPKDLRQATSTLTDREPSSDSSDSDSKDDLPVVSPMLFMTFSEALEIYRNIPEVCEVERRESEEKVVILLKRDLKLLHTRGLLIHFHHVPELSDMIFNNIPSFINVLKQILDHELMESKNPKNTSKICRQVWQGVQERKIKDSLLKQVMDRLNSSGLICCALLKNISIYLCMKMSSLVSLLVNLNIMFPVLPSSVSVDEHTEIDYTMYDKEDFDLDNSYIFCPFYIKANSETRCNEMELPKFQLQTRFIGSFPYCLFNSIALAVFKSFPDCRSMVFPASNSITVDISSTHLNVTVLSEEGKDVIDIVFKCALDNSDEIMELWNSWSKCCEAINNLENSWPEIFSDSYVLCTHCLLNESAVVSLIPYVKNQTRSETFVKCGEDLIPSALIYYPGT
jgi:signal recognition particle receptor subunit beta